MVKSSQDFWFYFTKQVSFWMRDDSLWVNGAKVWLLEGPFGGISCSWNLLFPCARSLWFTVACRWIPSSPFKTSMLWTGPAKPWPRYQRLSFLDVVRVTLARYQRSKTSTVCWGQFINFLRRSCKVSTRLWVLTCLALGEPSLQLAASNLPLTNKPTLHE